MKELTKEQIIELIKICNWSASWFERELYPERYKNSTETEEVLVSNYPGQTTKYKEQYIKNIQDWFKRVSNE